MKRDSAIALRVATQLACRARNGAISLYYADDDPERVRAKAKGTKSVDLIATAEDGSVFALEHTKIESYAGLLTDFEQMEAILIALEAELAGRLPADRRFELAAGMGAVADRSLDPEAVRCALVPWIIENAPCLAAGSPSTAPHHQIAGGPEALPVEVTLSAWPPSPEGGTLTVLRTTLGDADRMMALRVDRLRKALSTKLPKLIEHAPARTVLVLEDQDMATSNISLVWTALLQASNAAMPCDTVVVVETWLDPPTGTIVYDNGVWLDRFSENTFVLPAVDGLSAL